MELGFSLAFGPLTSGYVSHRRGLKLVDIKDTVTPPDTTQLFAARLERQRRGRNAQAGYQRGGSPKSQVHPKEPVILRYTELALNAFNAYHP